MAQQNINSRNVVTIQFQQPSGSPLVKKMDQVVKNRVVKNRAAVAQTALEFFLPLLESGQVAVMNGRVVFTKDLGNHAGAQAA